MAVRAHGTQFQVFAPTSRAGSGGSMLGVGTTRATEQEMISVSRQVSGIDVQLSNISKLHLVAEEEKEESTQVKNTIDSELTLLNTELESAKTRNSRAPQSVLDAAIKPYTDSIAAKNEEKSNADNYLGAANATLTTLGTQRQELVEKRDALETQREILRAKLLTAGRIPASGNPLWQDIPDITNIPTLPDQPPIFSTWTPYVGDGAPKGQDSGTVDFVEFEFTLKYDPNLFLIHEFLRQKYDAKEQVHFRFITTDGRTIEGYAKIIKFPITPPLGEVNEATVGFRTDGRIMRQM